jgi:hypothetical protein
LRIPRCAKSPDFGLTDLKVKKSPSGFWIAYPAKLRFEKTKNPKIISSKLDYFLTGLHIQQSSALKIQLNKKTLKRAWRFFF